MSDLAARIARARETVAKATPGPWARRGQSIGATRYDSVGIGYFGEVYSTGTKGSFNVAYNEANGNAALATLAVNALPALLDVAEAAHRNSAAREEYGLASGASHDNPGSICEACERVKSAADDVLDSEAALDAALAKVKEVLP